MAPEWDTPEKIDLLEGLIYGPFASCKFVKNKGEIVTVRLLKKIWTFRRIYPMLGWLS